MPDLGNTLRDKRIELGHSLDEIQERTKIQKRYLEAIEDGDFSRLPGSFYVRAFIRQYAEALGLNADELLEEMGESKKVTPEVMEEKVEDSTPSLSRIRNEKERLNYKYNKIIDLAPKILLVLSVVGIVFCIWKFAPPLFDKKDAGDKVEQTETPQMNVNENLDPAEDITNPTDEDTKKPDDQIAEPPADLEQGLTMVKTEGINTTYELKGTKEFQLKLVSTGVSYVDIKDSTGKMVYAGEIAEGDEPSYDFSKEQSVQINIGRSTDVKIYVNEEEVPYEIAPTDAVHQKIIINFVSSAS